MAYCLECGEPVDWDEDEVEEKEDGLYHSDCVLWEPETEEDEKAVEAFVFMIEREGWVEEAGCVRGRS